MTANTKPVLVLDLDHTLFHTLHHHHGDIELHSKLRPHVPEFMDSMSQLFTLAVFTMGTRDYAYDRCDALGISKWVPRERIRAREDTEINPETGQHVKVLKALLCESCAAKALVVDDSPAFWELPVFVPPHGRLPKRIRRPQQVIRICPYYFDAGDPEKDDRCLLGVAKVLETYMHRGRLFRLVSK